MATSGDLHLAINEDFPMAMDSKDLPAVVAALSQPYSNGPIEGANTKVKLLKTTDVRASGLPATPPTDPAQLMIRRTTSSAPEPLD